MVFGPLGAAERRFNLSERTLTLGKVLPLDGKAASSIVLGNIDHAWAIRMGPDTVPPIVPPRWLVCGYTRNGWFGAPSIEPFQRFFTNETEVDQPTRTPELADGIWESVSPSASDLPAKDLFLGEPGGMASITIPRHGSRPLVMAGKLPPKSFLPGAINASFFDGHAEQVPLERLWQLSWHRDYQAPAKRPSR